MRMHLVWRLAGPLQAWGTVAVGGIRPSAQHPTRSGVLGLVASSLGYRRADFERLDQLSKSFGFAVYTEAPGVSFTDYHTVQMPVRKAKREFYSRRDELVQKLEKHESLNTVLSTREYLADASFVVCLWQKEHVVAELTLDHVKDALCHPRLFPYLGRKSCAAYPFGPELMKGKGVCAAIRNYVERHPYPYGRSGENAMSSRKSLCVFSEPGGCVGRTEQELTTRDVMVNPQTRQFGTRIEQVFSLEEEKEGEPHVYE